MFFLVGVIISNEIKNAAPFVITFDYQKSVQTIENEYIMGIYSIAQCERYRAQLPPSSLSFFPSLMNRTESGHLFSSSSIDVAAVARKRRELATKSHDRENHNNNRVSNVKHVYGSEVNLMTASEPPFTLDKNFLNVVSMLPTELNDETKTKFKNFAEIYGTHYTTSIKMGGKPKNTA